jgi:hypothetical protein
MRAMSDGYDAYDPIAIIKKSRADPGDRHIVEEFVFLLLAHSAPPPYRYPICASTIAFIFGAVVLWKSM